MFNLSLKSSKFSRVNIFAIKTRKEKIIKNVVKKCEFGNEIVEIRDEIKDIIKDLIKVLPEISIENELLEQLRHKIKMKFVHFDSNCDLIFTKYPDAFRNADDHIVKEEESKHTHLIKKLL